MVVLSTLVQYWFFLVGNGFVSWINDLTFFAVHQSGRICPPVGRNLSTSWVGLVDSMLSTSRRGLDEQRMGALAVARLARLAELVEQVPSLDQHFAHPLDRLRAPAEVFGERLIAGIALAGVAVHVRDGEPDRERQAILGLRILGDLDKPCELFRGVGLAATLFARLGDRTLGVARAHGDAALRPG